MESRPSEPDSAVAENDAVPETGEPDEAEEVSAEKNTETALKEGNGVVRRRSENKGQKNEKMKHVHLDQLKGALKEKFDAVADAYVFFDILSSGYITHAQFRRALVRLGLGALAQEGLFQELAWKCVDGQRVFEREFFDLLQWHTTDVSERSKDLAQARIRREHTMKAEHNKAISLKAKHEPRPTPECDKLRGILQSKYTAVTDFMVALDMDLTDVSDPRHIRVGFKRLGINDVSVDALFKELADRSLPPGLIRNSHFARVLKWAPIDDLHQELTKSRLNLTHQRAKMEVTTLPAVQTTIREGPAIIAFRKLLANNFGSVVDAFVFFDLDCASELNRSKLLHGLARMKQFSAENDPAVGGEELAREFRLGKDSYISVSEFILRMKWHKAGYGSDLDQIVFDARKKMMVSNTMSQGPSNSTTKPHPPKKKRSQNHQSSPRPMAHGRAGSTEALQSPYTQRLSSEERSPRSLEDSRKEVVNAEHECGGDGQQSEQKSAESAESGQSDNVENVPRPGEHEVTANGNAEETSSTEEGPAELEITANGNTEEVSPTENHVQDRPPAQTDLEPIKDPDQQSPRGQANGVRKNKRETKRSLVEQRKGWDESPTHSKELAWLDDKIKKSLQLDLSASKRKRGRGQLWAWDPPTKPSRKKSPNHKGSQTTRRKDRVVKQLLDGLRERGFRDMIDAYVFFDVEGSGQMTPSQMQRGLVSLRIFQISVHELPFCPASSPSLFPTVGLAQFLEMLAPVDAEAGAVLKQPEDELASRLEEARTRRVEIVKAALGAVGSVTDRLVEDLRSRIMQGLSVEAADPPGQNDGRSQQEAEQRQANDIVPANPASASEIEGPSLTDQRPSEPTEEDEEKVDLEGDSEPSALPREKDQEGSGVGGGVSEASGPPDMSTGGSLAKMSYAKESCISSQEHSFEVSHQALVKPAEIALRSTPSAGTLQENASAASPAKGGYTHSRHRGVAFRLSSEAGDDGESDTAPVIEETSWTGQKLYRALSDDGGGDIGLESIVGRLGKLGLQRERTSMLVTRLCEQQPSRDENQENFIGEDDFVQAFEGMETEWQSQTPFAAPRNPMSPRRRSTAASHRRQTEDGALNDPRWSRFDEGLDETETEPPEFGIHATLRAQQITESEQFVRLDLGQGNWFEGQVSKHGVPHGSGLLILAPGDTSGRRWQLGMFRNGKLNDSGVMMKWDGSFYLGDFKDGTPHGAGVYRMVDDVVYEGEFRDGRKDGVGCLWVETGPSFFGEWVLGERHGRGITGSCNKLWLQKSSATWPKEGEDTGKNKGKAALPHSEIRTAIKFEEWVYVSSGKVSSASKNLPKKDREHMLEALLWNAAQARTAACEGWSRGQAILARMDQFMLMREKVARTEKGTEKGRTSKGSTVGAEGSAGLKRVLLPVADKFKRKEPPFVIPRIPIFNTITRHKPV